MYQNQLSMSLSTSDVVALATVGSITFTLVAFTVVMYYTYKYYDKKENNYLDSTSDLPIGPTVLEENHL